MSLDVLDIFEQIKTDGEVLVAYNGAIYSELISRTLEDVEAKLIKNSEQPKFIKKAYIILVEALQNLYHHLEMPPDFVVNSEKVNKFVFFVFSKVNNFAYKLTTGNFVKKDKKYFLKNRIEQINVLTLEELKDLYKNILNNDQFSTKGGGGLGMIDIARKTGNKLNCRFEKYNDEYYFFILEIMMT